MDRSSSVRTASPQTDPTFGFTLVVAWLLLGWMSLVCAAEREPASQSPSVDYLKQIKPLFQAHCYACHGALKQEGDLRLDTVQLARQGGDSGSAIDSGDPENSLLLERISASDPALRMPPEGKPLTAQQIELVRNWLASGAVAPSDEVPQSDPLEHWSFKKPIQQLPSGDSGSAAIDHPIDRWLAVAQRHRGVQPLQEAEPRQLLRRLTLDLVGVPPTPEEMEAYLSDNAPHAYERAVERLLARPEYGQRWGRHWMDVWRYSDWYGRRAVPDVMNSYPQIWRWRDWIVRSLNEDKGYDQMVTQMLAADELYPTDDENVVATGFIVRNWYKWNYETWMKDSVEHTGKAFLGLTLNCAMCHDHKYDPITHEDYFRFRAFFEPLELRHERVAGEADPGPFKKYVYAQSYGPITSGAIRIFDEKLDAQTFMFTGGDARNRIADRPPVDCGPPRALTGATFAITPVELPAEAAYPGLKEFVRREELSKLESERQAALKQLELSDLVAQKAKAQLVEIRAAADGPATAANYPRPGAQLVAQHAYADALDQLQVERLGVELAEARLNSLQLRIAADDATYRTHQSVDEAAQVAAYSQRRVAHLTAQHAALTAERGLTIAQRSQAAVVDNAEELERAKKATSAATEKLQAARAALDAARTQLSVSDSQYTPLSPKYPTQSTGRRTALARWLVSTDNPLTARVAVNHLWLRHFGRPLVESVDNFGLQGKRPEHPELLDWLAVELMRQNWSMKALHRLIVTSAAYRRSSHLGTASHPSQGLDRDNGSYWHFPVQRMQAEVVRDSLLACAGALDRTFGGPELKTEESLQLPRRGMYFVQHGEALMPFLSTFDAANVCDCYRRTSTVLPSQALALTNSEFVVHYSRLCATQLSARLGQEATAENRQIVDISSKTVDVSTKLVDISSNRIGAASDAAFVQLAFDRILNRPAHAEELQAALEFLHQVRTANGGDSVVTEASTASVQPPASDPGQRARENLVMALFNHSDFVTIR